MPPQKQHSYIHPSINVHLNPTSSTNTQNLPTLSKHQDIISYTQKLEIYPALFTLSSTAVKAGVAALTAFAVGRALVGLRDGRKMSIRSKL